MCVAFFFKDLQASDVTRPNVTVQLHIGGTLKLREVNFLPGGHRAH